MSIPLLPNGQPDLPAIIRAVAEGRVALVDVRELAEVQATGKAKGAHHIPMALLPLKANPQAPDALLSADKPVAIYCAAGGRAGMATQALQRMGFAHVVNLGGFSDWAAAGGATERV